MDLSDLKPKHTHSASFAGDEFRRLDGTRANVVNFEITFDASDWTEGLEKMFDTSGWIDDALGVVVQQMKDRTFIQGSGSVGLKITGTEPKVALADEGYFEFYQHEEDDGPDAILLR